jgi:hypothetical protein
LFFKTKIKNRPFTAYTFEDAQSIYEEYKKTGQLPDDAQIISPKNCFPILEHYIVIIKAR